MGAVTEPTAAPDAAPSPSDDEQLPEQMRVRREKLDRLVAAGVEPYALGYPRTTTIAQLRTSYDDLAVDTATGDKAAITGRVMLNRIGGKLCFATIRDESADLQVMLSLDKLGEERLADWKTTVDLGDHIGVTGEVITSRRGELSILADEWTLTSKALRPLPEKFKGLSDPEARVRQRYVDLVVTPGARDMVRARATVLASLRRTLDGHGFLEVETPVLQPLHGGAAARPFATHLNAFDQPMYLRIALELYLKRLVVGGLENVYEIGKTFRNEGVDSTHSPEFTMLEAYQAYGDYDTMAALTRALVLDAARAVGRTTFTAATGETVDLEQPWREITVYGAVSAAVGVDVTVDTPLERLTALASAHEVPLKPGLSAGEVTLELYEKLVEHTLIEPTFVRDYPEDARPLARKHRSEPGLVEAWDLIINGVELAPAYSELVDPVEQRRRLTDQSLKAAGGDPDAMQLDEDFLRALEYGAPPMGGLGLGVDRLVMLLTGANMREVVTFPLIRPES
ncbi:MAG: lysyl-tRNA synthetase, class [Frankiaceae bacterium]|nr:lysyl-tRNA synthetase, class [Frankiaceae bacterium]